MLFQQRFLDGIRNGAITVAFRRWTRPSVRTGGTLLTPVGQLSISSVARVEPEEISEKEARRAGYQSRDALLEDLSGRADGHIYRIELGALGPDPRVAVRMSATLTDQEHRDLVERLRRLDSHAPDGPWTIRTLQVIRSNPERRAGDLCRLVGQDKQTFKANVRKLKNLGLTESLEVGYRLAPRGVTFLARGGASS